MSIEDRAKNMAENYIVLSKTYANAQELIEDSIVKHLREERRLALEEAFLVFRTEPKPVDAFRKLHQLMEA